MNVTQNLVMDLDLRKNEERRELSDNLPFPPVLNHNALLSL